MMGIGWPQALLVRLIRPWYATARQWTPPQPVQIQQIRSKTCRIANP